MTAAAAWAGSIAAVIMCAGSLGVLLVRIGRREGKVDQILEQLAEWQQDHEDEHRAKFSGRDAYRPARHAGPRG